MSDTAAETISPEHYFIGCLIKDYPFVLNLCNTAGFKGEYLESPTAKAIWNCSELLFSQGACVDIASLVEAVEVSAKHIDATSASNYMMKAMSIAHDPHNLMYHLGLIKQKYRRRNATKLFSDGVDKLNSDHDVEDVSSWVKHSLSVMDSELNQLTESKDDKRVRMSERYKNIRNKGKSGITSRYPALQQMLASYQKSKLTIIAARPKMGKTTLALNEAVNSAYWENVPTAVFSIEMDHDELMEKAASDFTEMDNSKLRLGEYSEEDVERFMTDGVDQLMNCPLYIIDSPSQTIESICSKTRQLVAEHGVELVVIDYLQIISSTPGSKFQSRTYEIGHMTNQLRILAKETGCAILVLSQITRPPKGVEGQSHGKMPMPTMADLRDSGAIEQDAYAIIVIGETQQPTAAPSWMGIEPMCVRVEANRGGSRGDFEAWFNKPNNKFMSQAEYDRYRHNYFANQTRKTP